MSTNRVIYQVLTALRHLVRVRKPGLKVPHKWQDLVTLMENYTSRLKYEKVIWKLPMVGWLKVNTDGASKGNPGRSSIGICIRDEVGDLKYAMGKEITEGSNTEAEAIVEALRICRACNYTHIWLQTDSMLMKNIWKGHGSLHGAYSSFWKDLPQISHTYIERETN